ncbi:hypothetical protein [Acinetobacter baumannii]|uniref:hypothetical protein n=1 Tax=Acinetobacter baumannii TaxID=470 RepID=UPI0022EABBA4|nr:hypothetical protein [Acinetobacter baumannii]MDA3587453.1 hypothetical protein [Acinetobacter baumannii]
MSTNFTRKILKQLISKFLDKKLVLGSAHSYELIAGFLGCKSHIALQTRYPDLETEIFDIQSSRDGLSKVIDRMRDAHWKHKISLEELYIMIDRIVYPPMYIIWPDDVRYIYSPYLDLSTNERGELIATYKPDFYDLEYARSIGTESFIITEQCTKTQIQDYLERFSIEEEIDDPSRILIGYQKFDTSKMRDRNDICRILHIT